MMYLEQKMMLERVRTCLVDGKWRGEIGNSFEVERKSLVWLEF